MSINKKYTFLLSAILTSAMAFSANASLITVSSDGGFTAISGHASATTSGTVSTIGGEDVYSSTEWIGNGTSPSSFTTSHQTDVVIENLNTSYLLNTFSHESNYMNQTSEFTLAMQYKSMLSFSDSSSTSQSSSINATETFDDEACVGGETEDGTATGDVHEHGILDDLAEGCDDYFDFSSASLFEIPMFIAGKNYMFTTFFSKDADGSSVLSGSRFWDFENESTNLYTFGQLTIVPEAVPEPSTLSLLALIMMGLGWSTRKKLSKK